MSRKFAQGAGFKTVYWNFIFSFIKTKQNNNNNKKKTIMLDIVFKYTIKNDYFFFFELWNKNSR